MLSVAEAIERITRSLTPLSATDRVQLTDAAGRVLAAPVISRRRQPPSDVSAMDGYAIRAADAERLPARLKVIGSVPAGSRFERTIAPGEAVRIFTGAPLPPGSDTIVIQENTGREDDVVVIHEGVVHGKHIRRAGLDFAGNVPVLEPPRRLSPLDVALAAAAGAGVLTVRTRPRVAIMATGDELARPGAPLGPSQIYSSSVYGLSALVNEWGGEAVDLGIARDDKNSLIRVASQARGSDLFITLGGASVGDHDLVQSALGSSGLKIDFWKIAMRPGKPLMFGRFREIPMIGLPGNPVSALVCAILFLRPAIETLLGLPPTSAQRTQIVFGVDLPANDTREDYLRASLKRENGKLVATPFSTQDSSMLSALANAECLIVRAPFAPEARSGDSGEAIPLTHGAY